MIRFVETFDYCQAACKDPRNKAEFEAALNDSISRYDMVVPHDVEFAGSFDTGLDRGFCLISKYEDRMYIITRGTDGRAAWRSNFNYNLVDPNCSTVSDGMVSSGFYDGFKRMKPIIADYIESYATGSTTITFGGHSRGGAESVMGARMANHKMGFEYVDLFTYGQPRVGDSLFINGGELSDGTMKKGINQMGINYVRFVNNRDIVCGVPLKTMGYRHGGRKVRIGTRFQRIFQNSIVAHSELNYGKSIRRFCEGHM